MDRNYFQNNHWQYYMMLEEKFIKTLNFVELNEDNYNTYSKEFASLIIVIGAELDAIFKLFCSESNEKNQSITDYAKYILDIYPDIRGQSMSINKEITIKPFSLWSKEQPGKSLSWWSAYTDIKHDRILNYKEATLDNCLNIIGALFLLEMKIFLSFKKDKKDNKDIPDRDSQLFVLDNWKNNYSNVDDLVLEDLGEVDD